MTQPNQTTPTALSTGPWTITACECGATELDHRGMPPECEATHHQWRIEVIPLSTPRQERGSMSEPSKIEAYLRADQAYRLAHARALLKHKKLDKDLREAQAGLDVEGLLDDRLEALVAFENERDALSRATLTAVRDGWTKQAQGYVVPPTPQETE